MKSRKTGAGRLAIVAAIGAVVIAIVGACGVDSPKEQGERERKAASVQVFRLHMTKDLWERTHTTVDYSGVRSVDKPLRLTNEPNGTVTVDLSGPQLVDYLQTLDYNAHGGGGAKDESLARAVYDTISPVIDKIQNPAPPNAPIPDVTIDAGPGTSAAPAASPTAAAPAK